MTTVRELKQIAKNLGLRGYSRMKKSELVNLLKNNGHVFSSIRPTRSRNRRPTRSRNRRPTRSRNRRPTRSRNRRPTRSRLSRKVTLKFLRAEAKRIGLKGFSKLKKSELQKLLSGKTRVITKHTSNQNEELKCTQDMEATSFVEMVSEIPKDLIIKLKLSPTVIHCYNIVDLRSWMLAGNIKDPMTRIQFQDKQIEKVKKQWQKLKKEKSNILLQKLKEDLVISKTTNKIPDWKPKKKICNYEFMISIATPNRFFSAVHIIPKSKWNAVKNLNNGMHTQHKTFNKIVKASKWSLEFPASSDGAVTGGVQYPNNNGDIGILDAGSDGSAILASFQKLWEGKKLLTTKSFSNGRRTSIDDGKFKLNMPHFAKILDKNISGTITNTSGSTFMYAPTYKKLMNTNKNAKKVLETGSILIDVNFWDKVRGGYPSHIRNPSSLFYNYWLALSEQLSELSYQETSQY